jgi:hypothetical protein
MVGAALAAMIVAAQDDVVKGAGKIDSGFAGSGKRPGGNV